MKSKPFTIKQQTLFGSKAYQNFALGLFTFLAAYLVASLLAPVHNSSAEEQHLSVSATNTVGAVSVTAANPNISLDVGQPTSAGKMVKASDSVTAQTASESGYQLYVSMDNNQAGGNRLYSDGDSSSAYISANHDSDGNDIVAGLNTEATLSTNSWGFTVYEDNYNADKFAAMPLMGNEVLIKEATAPGEDEIPIYFGVMLNTNIATGTYTGDIIYTIISEGTSADNYSTPSVNFEKGIPGMNVEITLPLRAPVTSVSELGTITAKFADTACENATSSISGASIKISCITPNLTAGAKDVSVYVQQYSKTYSNQGGFTYITNMQDMTVEMCDNIATGYIDQTFMLSDSRDGKSYKIVKHKDNNCWMQQNLALDGGITLTPADSNVTMDRPLEPNISSGTSMTNERDYIFSGTADDYTSSCYVNPNDKSCVVSTETYGNHYNWIAATAGAGTATTTGTIKESVCPSARDNETWRLPDNGTTTGLKSYSNLAYAYGLSKTNIQDSTMTKTAQQNPLSFPLNGYYSSAINDQAYRAYYWTRTVSSDAAKAYMLNLFSGGSLFYPQHTGQKSTGYAIRCVLGE